MGLRHGSPGRATAARPGQPAAAPRARQARLLWVRSPGVPCGTAWLRRRLTGTARSGVWCGRGSGQDALGTEEPAQRRKPLPRSPRPRTDGSGSLERLPRAPQPTEPAAGDLPTPTRKGPSACDPDSSSAGPELPQQDQSSHHRSPPPALCVCRNTCPRPMCPSRTAFGE